MHWSVSAHDAALLVEALRTGRPRFEARKIAGDDTDDIRDRVEVAMEAFRAAAQSEMQATSRGRASESGKSKKDDSKDGVEGRLSIQLYEAMKDLSPEVLTDPGFWRYLAVWEMFEFIQWRDGANCKLVSFGAQSHTPTWDCVPKRMFVRARIAEVAKGAEGAEALAGVPGTDLWRSHVLRVKTGNSPKLAAALVEAYERKDIRTSTVRDVAKRIKRLRSNLVFELLDEVQVDDILNKQIARAREEA